MMSHTSPRHTTVHPKLHNFSVVFLSERSDIEHLRASDGGN